MDLGKYVMDIGNIYGYMRNVYCLAVFMMVS